MIEFKIQITSSPGAVTVNLGLPVLTGEPMELLAEGFVQGHVLKAMECLAQQEQMTIVVVQAPYVNSAPLGGKKK